MSPEIVTFILICALPLPPQNCTEDTATDVLGGMEAKTPMECMINGQALIAQSALNMKDQYLKIVCVHPVDSVSERSDR